MFTHPLIQSLVSYVGFMFGAPAVTGPLFVNNAPSVPEAAVVGHQNDGMDSRFYVRSINRAYGDRHGFQYEDRWSPMGTFPPTPGSGQLDRFGDFA